MGGVTTGWGTALGPKLLTNADLEADLDTSDSWIRERSGIEQRHVGGTTSQMAAEAGRAALQRSGLAAADIDLLILATCTPDATMPSTSVAVAADLDLSCGSFDLNAACGGFVYALGLAYAQLDLGARNVLVIGADAMSRIVDWNDRDTAVLFGDGAGALVLSHVDGPGELLAFKTGADTSGRHLITCASGSTIQMEGRELFRRGVRALVEGSQQLLAAAGVGPDDVALLVPHQANLRITLAAAERLGIDKDRVAMHITQTANTSAASVPLALIDAIEHDRLRGGDLVLQLGFGAGMSWAGALVRWSR